MSGSSGSGAPPPAGVVCNSALSFVASAQALQQPESVHQENLGEASGDVAQADRIMPPGLKALCDACSKLYPDQPNPLQVTTRLKYWLGGEDPLDYISMYWNPGKPEEDIPPHWHYISFGLSDLHGDGRVHPPPAPGGDSGYGFELTMRVRGRGPGAPLWPAALLQALARYVFTTGNKFCAGDHISWHRALDGGERSRVRHLLVERDPALSPANTPHGGVQFMQIVGCTSKELRAAQRGSGFDVLELMREDPNCGGPFLVTSPRRRASARGVRARRAPAARAPLAGVSCDVRWTPAVNPKTDEASSSLSAGVEQQIKDTLRRGLSAMSTDSQPRGQAVGHMSTDSFEMSSIERALPQITDTMGSWSEENSVRYYDAVNIYMNAEGASLLPLAIDGRIKQGAHFTWRSGARAVSLLPPSVTGAAASARNPHAARDHWLQVVITPEQADELSSLVAGWEALGHSDSESEGEAPAPAPPQLPLVVTTGKITITVL